MKWTIPGARTTYFAAAAALLAAIALPPVSLAGWLRSPGDAGIPQLITGFWILKVLLAVHALIAVLFVRRLPSRGAPKQPASSPSHWPVVALLSAGLLLRLPGLNVGLWYDEIQTLVEYVRQPWGVVLTTFDSSNQHLLFSLGARAMRSIAGESAASLRFAAVLFGAMSLWAAVSFGRCWLARREAWWAGILLAVSYHHVWFSQNARGYTGLLLGTLVGSTLFVNLIRAEAPSRRLVWTYASVMALTLLTHVTALVVVAGHAACWLASLRGLPNGPRRWAPMAALALACSVATTMYAPVLPQLIGALSSSGTSSAGIEWQSPLWFVGEAIAGLRRGIPAGGVAVPLAGIIVLAGMLSAWRTAREAFVVMVVPVVTMGALLVATGHNLWPRFFFFGAAFFVQLGVRGGFSLLERILPRFAKVIGDAGLAALTAASLFLLPRAWSPKQDFPAAQRYMNDYARPGDAIAVTDMLRLPMVEWLRQPWPVVDSRDALQRLEGPHTTWVAYTFPIRLSVTAPELYGYIQSDYKIAHVIPATIGGGEIVIMKKNAASALSRANRRPRTSTQ